MHKYAKVFGFTAAGMLFLFGIFSQKVFAVDSTFSRQIIDSAISGDVKAMGDIDGDGFLDLVMGGHSMHWYKYPSWTKSTISTINGVNEYTTDMQLADVDNDGDLDIVTAENTFGNNVIWLENPRPLGDPTSTWTKHVIGSHGDWSHDIEVGDIDRDGKIDVVTRKSNTYIRFQNTPDSWTTKDITSVVGGDEGMALGDIDSDGDLDLASNGKWIEAPADTRNGTWIAHNISSGWPSDTTAAIADLNRDGRNDVVFIGQHARGKFAWYQAPVDPINGIWVERILDNAMGSHKLNTGDMNRDGRLDIVAGLELEELAVYTQGNNLTFTKNILSNAGLHNQRIGDVGNDGDLDIFGANWIGHPPAELWENTSATTLALSSWTYKEITNGHSQTFGLAFADVDSDSRKDIISGQYWYKNSGDLLGVWTQSAAFPNSIEAIASFDVDGDNLADVFGQKTEGSELAIYWMEATSTAGNAWTFSRLGGIPAASHALGSQGYKVADIRPGGKPELIINSGSGVWYFQVPNSLANPWTIVQINANPAEEGVGVGDIDRDGYLDVAGTTLGTNRVEWYRNPRTGAVNWTAFVLGNFPEAQFPDRTEIADFNRDGRLDVVVSEENGISSDAQTYWWEQPTDPASPNWIKRLITTQGTTNSMDVADMDLDGDSDVVLAEHRGTLKLSIQENISSNFTERVISTGKESHLGARLVDLDGDGDQDIISIAFDSPQFIHLWRNDNSIFTAPDTTPPQIFAVNSNPTSTTATITWSTDENSDSQVEYGTTTTYGFSSILDTNMVLGHSVNLSGLTPSTLYHYRVKSKDAAGNLATSIDSTFTTQSSNPPPASGLIAHWKLDEGAGSVASDSSGSGYTGTLQNSPVWTQGQINSALTLNGTNQYINLPNINVTGSAMTITGWIRSSAFPGTVDQRFISKSTDIAEQSHYWMLGQTNTGSNRLRFRLKTASTTTTLIASSGNLVTNVWYHAAATYDGSMMRLYLNGVEVGSASKGGSLATSSSVPVNIGRSPDGSSYMSGNIDDVRIYNRGLTASEIVQVMNDTGADTTPPIRSNGTPTGTLPETTTSTVISLTTDENATCKYGTVANTPYESMTNIFTTTGTLNHSAVVSVSAGNTYTYYVRCIDQTSNVNTTDFLINFSVAAPDTTNPSVTITSPTNGEIVAGTIPVTTNASDDRGVNRVEFKVDGLFHSSDSNTPYTTNINTTLLSEGVHSITATAFDVAENFASHTVNVTVQNQDTTPPTIPANLSATAVSVSQINLSWNASTDNVGVTGYRIFRNGIVINTSVTTSYADLNLNPSTTHTYNVTAFDAAGNESAQSLPAQATTHTPDTTAPLVTNVNASNITSFAATITWDTDELSDTQVQYGTTTNYGLITPLNSSLVINHSVNLSGLTALTLYHYRVLSRDAAGNLATSSDFTFTTLATPVIPNLITHWKLDEGTGTSASDSVGSNHGTLTNGPIWGSGQFGSAVTFDGVNDYINLPIMNVTGTGLTLTAWVKFSSFPNSDQRIISKANNNNANSHYWMLGHTNDGGQQRLRFRLRTGSNTTTLNATSGNMLSNVWYHATATYDGTTMRLYLNGVQVASTSKTGSIATSSSIPVNIGRNPDNSNHLRGTLDDVRIYNRGLSASEINSIMTGN
jgi:hypothetical protein